jgi:hypothetical protein
MINFPDAPTFGAQFSDGAVIWEWDGNAWDTPKRTPPWTPAQLPGLVCWYDAQTPGSMTLNGADVAQWDDLSGNGYNAVQAVATAQPLYVDRVPSFRNKPALYFNYVDKEVLAAPKAAGVFDNVYVNYFASSMGIYSSAQSVSPIACNRTPFSPPPVHRFAGVFCIGDGIGNTTYSCQAVGTGFLLIYWGLRYDKATDTYDDWLDGAPYTTKVMNKAAIYTDPSIDIRVGLRSDGIMAIYGYIGEAIAATELSEADRLNLDHYLSTKWKRAPINFPSAPVVGDTFEIYDLAWTWDGTAWN